MGCHYRGTPSHSQRGRIAIVHKIDPDARSRARRADRRRGARRRGDAVHGRAGQRARIAADPDGNGHVVWGIPSRGGQPAKIGYCRIPAGGSACDITQGVRVPVGARSGRAGRPAGRHRARAAPDGGPDLRLLHELRRRKPRRSRLRLAVDDQRRQLGPAAVHRCRADRRERVARHDADRRGAAERRAVDRLHQHVRFARRGQQGARLRLSGRGRQHRRHGRRRATSTRRASSPSPSTAAPSRSWSMRRATSTRSSTRSTRARLRRAVGQRLVEVVVQPQAALVAPVPDSAEPQLSSGPDEHVPDLPPPRRRRQPDPDPPLQQRPDGGSFGPSSQLQGADPIDNSADAPDSVQDVSGRVHVIWTSQHDGGRLRYIQSDVVRRDVHCAGQRRARRDLRRSRRRRRAERRRLGGLEHRRRLADPRREAGGDLRRPDRHAAAGDLHATRTGTPPNCKTPTTTAPTGDEDGQRQGRDDHLRRPAACVKRGSTFKATLTWKKKKRKGNLFVKVAKADFYIGTKIVKTDRVAPFTQTLTVNGDREGRLEADRSRPRAHQGQARQEPQEVDHLVDHGLRVGAERSAALRRASGRARRYRSCHGHDP